MRQCNRWHGVHYRQFRTRTSPLQRLLTPEAGEELACQRKKGNPNDVYSVAVRLTLVSLSATFRGSLAACSLHVSASEWYDRPKLAHGPVKFSARSISHFAMNIIMAKTFSTAKVNSAKCHNFSNPPKYLPAKISGHTVYLR